MPKEERRTLRLLLVGGKRNIIGGTREGEQSLWGVKKALYISPKGNSHLFFLGGVMGGFSLEIRLGSE